MPSFLSRKKAVGGSSGSGQSGVPPAGIATSISAPTGFTHVAHMGSSYNPTSAVSTSSRRTSNGYANANLSYDDGQNDFVPNLSAGSDAHLSYPYHSDPNKGLGFPYDDPNFSSVNTTVQSNVNYPHRTHQNDGNANSRPAPPTSFYRSSNDDNHRNSDHQKQYREERPDSNHRFSDSSSSVASNILESTARSSRGTTASSVIQIPEKAMTNDEHNLSQPSSLPKANDHSLHQPSAVMHPQENQMTPSSSSMGTLTINSPTVSSNYSNRKTSSRYALADFEFLRTLGTGSFGRVHLVKSRHNSRYYAIKVS